MYRKTKAFSLIELMITIAIIGMVSAMAIPAYRSYIDTSNMTKVNAAYESGIRIVRQEYAKNMIRQTMGLPSSFPSSSDKWKEILNPDDEISAPGGGPAYDLTPTYAQDKAPKKGKAKKDKLTIDYDLTGAIRIDIEDTPVKIDVYRPAYRNLTALRARIALDSIEVTNL